jgi:putative two-component system response regulator
MMPTILLVDRYSPDRDDWKAFLQNQGFEVVVADSEQSAVQQSLELHPDLVLLHDTLPEITAYELCTKLKTHPLLHETTPVVLVMSSAGAEEAPKTHQSGADDYWGLPTSRWEALSRIQSLLQMRAYIDEQAKSVLLSLAQSIEAKDPKKVGHSERLSEYALQLGESLDLTDEDLETLRVACLLHDIGKIAVPDAILTKPGPLTPGERLVMNQHPVVGEGICAPLKSLRRVLPIIRHHHERMDGSGYPDGLRGYRIPLKARILQIADIFDALVNDRPYRDALPPDDALGILIGEARCGWLDAPLVRRFCEICQGAGHFLPRSRSMLASYYA